MVLILYLKLLLKYRSTENLHNVRKTYICSKCVNSTLKTKIYDK